MGQMTYAIMYGVEEDDSERWCGDDGDGGVVGAFKAQCKPMIDAAATKRGMSPWNVEHWYIPDHTHGDTDLPVYGFWIAVGASGKRGVPDLCSVAINAMAVHANYPASYVKARRRWRRFARFCASRGFELPKARLWLVQTEVA